MPRTSIDLAHNRQIVFTVGAHIYRLLLAPIPKAAWLKYYAAIDSTSETVGGKRIDSFDAAGARLQLVTDALVAAEGYRTRGGGPVSEVPNWKDLIPTGHRLAAGNMLVSVAPSEAPDGEAVMLGGEAVTLDAVWTAAEGGTEMEMVKGLEHVFSAPSIEQQRRYNRDGSRSQIVGGSRTGKTRWMGAQATLVALYDELIQEVGGYLYDGNELGDRETIIRVMDTHHKVAAAEALFAPAQPQLKEAE